MEPETTPFWTEHRESCAMTSGLAAVEIGKDRKDPLGRWCPGGSDDSVRTYRAVVKRLQIRFAKVCQSENFHEKFDEEGSSSELEEWLVK